MSALSVVIPCKRLVEGKSRLAGLLDPATRTRLCTGFLRRTIALAAHVTPVSRVMVVSSDALALAQVREAGGLAVEERTSGLNEALECARRHVPPGSDRLLVLPIDLPFATAAALGAALARSEDVVIAPDAVRDGTNLLALSARAMRTFPFKFGPGSFSAHTSAAAVQGLSFGAIEDERLSFDVDDEAAYRRWTSAAVTL